MTVVNTRGPEGTPAGGPLDVLLDPVELRDVEACLLGLLPDGHELGGPVGTGPPGPLVRVRRDVGAGQRVLVLRDEEHTPVAEVRDGHGEAGLVAGRLVPLRRREGAARADLALARHHLGTVDDRTTLLLVDRVPTRLDAARLPAAARSQDAPVVAVVADDPRGDVPVPVLAACTEAWLRSGDAGVPADRARVLVAPLPRRDAVSDRRARRLLSGALGARPDVDVHIGAEDGSPAAQAWRTVAAELREGRADGDAVLSPAVAQVVRRWRPPRLHRGLCMMFTGLSGSGKSTLARDLAEWLPTHSHRAVTLLDGDRVRRVLSSGLGFDRSSREENVRRIGFVAAEVTRHGGTVICSPIAPFDATRREVRAMVEQNGDFLLVHVSTPLPECERRDLKGLYAQARSGALADFTGVSSPYEVPHDADLRIDTSTLDRDAARDAVLALLQRGGWIEAPG